MSSFVWYTGCKLHKMKKNLSQFIELLEDFFLTFSLNISHLIYKKSDMNNITSPNELWNIHFIQQFLLLFLVLQKYFQTHFLFQVIPTSQFFPSTYMVEYEHQKE